MKRHPPLTDLLEQGCGLILGDHSSIERCGPKCGKLCCGIHSLRGCGLWLRGEAVYDKIR